jgi:hypothetical protein
LLFSTHGSSGDADADAVADEVTEGEEEGEDDGVAEVDDVKEAAGVLE